MNHGMSPSMMSASVSSGGSAMVCWFMSCLHASIVPKARELSNKTPGWHISHCSTCCGRSGSS